MKLLLQLIFISISANFLFSQSKFKIDGNLKSEKNYDLKKVYLKSEIKVLDSTLIKNNKFYFEGNITEPTQVYIDSKLDRKALKTDWFWIEGSVISKIDDFTQGQNARIKGGETQRQSNLLEKKLINLRKRRDSLKSIINSPASNKEQIEKANKSYDKLYQEAMNTNINFIKDYPNSVLSMSMIYNVRGRLGLNYVKEFYFKANQSAKKSFHGLKIENYLNLFKSLKEGDKCIDFTHMNNHDIPLKFSELRKEITLLQFWNPEFKKSINNNLNLVKIYQKYKDDNFEIVGVALTRNKGKWQKVIERDNLNWPQLSELKGWDSELGFRYGVYILPLNYLINKDGDIIGKNITPNKLQSILEQRL